MLTSWEDSSILILLFHPNHECILSIYYYCFSTSFALLFPFVGICSMVNHLDDNLEMTSIGRDQDIHVDICAHKLSPTLVMTT